MMNSCEKSLGVEEERELFMFSSARICMGKLSESQIRFLRPE